MKNKSLCFGFAALLALAFTGCGNKSSSESSEQPAATSATPGATVDAATAGTVAGTVKLDGTAPRMRPINMSAEPYCQKANKEPVVPPEVVTGDGGTLANVVVYVKDDMSKYSFPTPSDAVPLAQQGCMYDPHVVALMAGQTLEVENDDQTTHNIHPMPRDNREWNKSQPPGAAPIADSFARPELAIPVKCNVHPWMKSYIFVFKNPYYAVTSRDGKFEIKDLPPGTYTLVAWQEKYGTQEQTVTIAPKESKEVSFTFKASGAAGD
jgi:plastocyanin